MRGQCRGATCPIAKGQRGRHRSAGRGEAAAAAEDGEMDTSQCECASARARRSIGEGEREEKHGYMRGLTAPIDCGLPGLTVDALRCTALLSRLSYNFI
jgi:hypothetical protein